MSKLEMTAEFSLASFAEMETDDIKALDSLLPPAGIFAMKVTSAQLGQNPPKEGIDEDTGLPYLPLVYLQFKYEVLDAQPADKAVDPETLLGRTWSERFTFWPKQLQDNIALLKGRYAKAGVPNSGRMGGLEGGEPGWIDGIVEEIIKVKIRHSTNKTTGNTNAYFDWMKFEKQAPEAE